MYCGRNVNEDAIRSASDDTLERFLGEDIVSKLETKIPGEYKRKMLEDIGSALFGQHFGRRIKAVKCCILHWMGAEDQ
jgi:hypothetical protein